jgi:hypothetical protein
MVRLNKDGFKRIKTRHKFLCCGGCGKRYAAGTEAYWKRSTDATGGFHTIILCQDCFTRVLVTDENDREEKQG